MLKAASTKSFKLRFSSRKCKICSHTNRKSSLHRLKTGFHLKSVCMCRFCVRPRRDACFLLLWLLKWSWVWLPPPAACHQQERAASLCVPWTEMHRRISMTARQICVRQTQLTLLHMRACHQPECSLSELQPIINFMLSVI